MTKLIKVFTIHFMKKDSFWLSLLFVLSAVGLSVSVIAQTPSSTPSSHNTSPSPVYHHSKPKTLSSQVSQEKHLWNLQDVDILKVIAEVSRETGKNFIVDPLVTGKITMISSEPISSDEVYPLFLSTLQILGFGTVDSGDLIKIIPLKDAVQNGRVHQGKLSKTGDALIVKVISLKNVSAVQLAPSLTPIVPSWANVSAYAPSNSIIVSGTVSIVKRVEDIIHNVDTPFANGIDIIRLNYADATEVVKSIEKLEQGHRFSTGDYGSSVSADVRSNSIMLGGSDATRLHYKVLITQLDVPSAQNSPKELQTDTQVFTLKFNSVTAILPVLRSVVRQSVNVNVVDTASSGSSSSYSSSSSSSSGSGGVLTASKIPEVTNASLNAGASNSSDQSGITIVGDVPNNALIITAPPNIMRTLKAVIQQLDIRPKQVLIQAIIAEVNATDSLQLGIQWSNKDMLGVSSVPLSFGVGFIRSGSLNQVMSALAIDNNTNILSTPSLTVLNNGNAAINIGSSVSIATGAVSQPGLTPVGGLNTNYTYAYKDLGLALNVVPQITFDDSINMKITQSNTTLSTTTSVNQGGGVSANPNPNINSQSLATSVLVKNEDILVLGGLTQNQEAKTITKVPFLSAIPLLGKLFQYENKSMVKKDLLIFLRPVILNNAEDAILMSKNKYEMMRNTELEGLKEMRTEMGFRHQKNTSVLPDTNHQELPEPFSA
jgi:general secretion pathway protein D